jgi:hypothetical protein
MRTYFMMLLCFILFCGAGCVKKQKPVITIGTIEISAAEFEAAYQQGRVQAGSELTQAEFLQLFINRKLFLKEAEVLGLDKDPQFIQSLQMFWEQALMKSVIARKINESTLVIRVSDNEIADYYDRHKDTDFSGKQLSDVKTQIKLLLFQLKQKLQLQEWMTNLRKRTKINIDYGQLRILPDQKEGE